MWWTYRKSLLWLTQKTLTVFCLPLRHVKKTNQPTKKGCSWHVQGETEWYRPKCTRTNAWGDQMFFCNHPSIFSSPHHSDTFTSIQVIAFSFSVKEIYLLAVVLTFHLCRFINLRLSDSRIKNECLTCYFSKLLVFIVVNFC